MSVATGQATRANIELASTHQVEPLWFGEQHIVITLAGTPYAVPLTAVQEVENPPPVVPVPFAPDWIAGVVNLRGAVLTLVDLPDLLGLGSWRRGAEAKILVLRGDEQVAVAVDGLRGMRRLPEQERSHIEGALPGQVARYISGMYRSDDDLLGILDIERLLADADAGAGVHGAATAIPSPMVEPDSAIQTSTVTSESERGDARAFAF